MTVTANTVELLAIPDPAAGRLHRLRPQFVDPRVERGFQEASLAETRNGILLLALAGAAAAALTLYGGWAHLPHDHTAYLLGQGIRSALLLGSCAGVVLALHAQRPETLLWTGTALLAVGCLTLSLRMTTPPAADAALFEALFFLNRDGTTLLLILAVAVLTLIVGHFVLNASLFALALVGFLAVVNTWPSGVDNTASFNYAFAMGFVFVLALGHGIQRIRRQVYVARLQLQQANAQLLEFATRDYLTNCFNRRHFYAVAEQEMERAQRHGSPLSVIVMDLDHFKSVNDRHGHACGDSVLKQIVRVVQNGLRTSDVLARVGGEEFSLLLPETDLEEARVLAERLRSVIAATPFRHDRLELVVSASFGVAERHPDDPHIDNLLQRADKALYEAKRGGRNQVRLAARAPGVSQSSGIQRSSCPAQG